MTDCQKLIFPTRHSLGSIFVAPVTQPETWELLSIPLGLVTKPENQPICWEWLDEARGEIVVPENMKVKLKVSSITLAGISFLNELPAESIHLLDVSRTQFGDDSLRYITHLSGLRVLELAYTAITNHGVEQIKSLTGLQSLGLTHTPITNSALQHLSSLTQLRELWLNGTLTDDEGLVHLRNLQDLKLLGLSGTRVTDDAFVELKRLKSLLRVYMFGADITTEGTQSLRESLPGCRVKWCRSSNSVYEPEPNYDYSLEGEREDFEPSEFDSEHNSIISMMLPDFLGSASDNGLVEKDEASSSKIDQDDDHGLDWTDELTMINSQYSRAGGKAQNSLPPLAESSFWSIIEMLDWKKEGDDESVIEPCIRYLADKDDDYICSFLETLSTMLYKLDGEDFARNIGRASYRGKKDYFSRSWFLSARCCVVANGKEAFEEVISDPAAMPKDYEFRALLRIAGEAYRRKNGKRLDYMPSRSIKTFSNKEGWRNND